MNTTQEAPPRKRLPKEIRHRQLLETALRIVRDEGADRLTLAYLAEAAGVSKPVTYEHFGSRAMLLIELYRSIDDEQVATLQAALKAGHASADEAVRLLADTYIHCSVANDGVWRALKDALSGSPEMDVVARQLSDQHVKLFASVLERHTDFAEAELERRSIALIGAGDALAEAMTRGRCTEHGAADTLALLVNSCITR